MLKNNLLEMTNEIQAFIEQFKVKYNQSIEVTVGLEKVGLTNSKKSLVSLEKIIIQDMHEIYPEYSHVKSFKYRTRYIEFMRYCQSFQYIAYMSGNTYMRIGKYIGRDHASVINSVKKVKNYLYCNDIEFARTYFPLLKKIKDYVGTISDNTKRQIDPQSVLTTLCYKE